jgi:anti-sigma B factor antagonist
MVLEKTIMDGTVVITLPRRFDVDSVPLVETGLKPIIAENPERVLFDFSKTDYVSSAGMRVLLASSRSIKEGGGTVALSSLGREVKYVLETTGFTKIFTVYETREKALKHMNKKP